MRRLASLCAAAWAFLGVIPTLRAEPPLREYQSSSLAAFVDFGYGSSAVGDTLMGDLGAEFTGIETFGGRALLVQWDALFAARGGLLGNTHPYTPLVGPRTLASVEVGYRWLPEDRWSLYTGAGLSGDLSLLTHPGTDIVQLRTFNNMDGVGGRTAHAALRLDAGFSLLEGARSLLIVAFFQEGLRAPAIYTRGEALSLGGVAVRFDLAYRLTVSVEGLGGRSGTITDPSLGTTDRTTYAGFSALVRKTFGNGMWLGVAGGYSREFDHRVYTGSSGAYDTANAPTYDARLLYAVPLGKRGPTP